MKSKILIVEPDPSGHHLSLYVTLICKALEKDYDIFLLTTEKALLHPSLKLLQKSLFSNIIVHTMSNIDSPKINGFIQLFIYQLKMFFKIKYAFNDLIRTHDFEKVIFPTLDHCDKVISIFGSPFQNTPYFGIYMSPKFHRNAMGIGAKSRSDFLYFYLFKKMLSSKNLIKVLIVDPLFKEYINKFNFKSAYKLVFFNEPINLIGNTTKEKARYLLGIPKDSNVILIYGDISKRKGVIQIANSIRLLDNKYLLLIAGTINHDLKDFFESDVITNLIVDKKLIISNGFKNEVEQFNYFISSDVVSVAYESSFTSSSGVYYQACSIGKPVLVNKCGLLYWLVQKYNNGIGINLNDKESIANEIDTLFNNKSIFTHYSNQSKLIAKNHSPDQFINCILTAINLMP